MLKEHGMPPPSTSKKERHKPATSICHIHFLSSIIYAKESDILWRKPNVVSVCGGVYRSLFPVESQLCVVVSWRSLFIQITQTQEEHPPRKNATNLLLPYVTFISYQVSSMLKRAIYSGANLT